MSDRRGWKLAGAGLLSVPALVMLGALTPVRALANTSVACNDAALIAAINAANAGGGGTLDLTMGCIYEYSVADNATDAPGTALPVITSTITINGGYGYVRRAAGAATNFRLFDIGPTGSLTLNYLAVSQGAAPGSGGGILDQGHLAVAGGTISDNTGSGVLQTSSAAGMSSVNNGFFHNTEDGVLNQGTALDTFFGGGIRWNTGAGVESNGSISVEESLITDNLNGLQTVNPSSTNTITVKNAALTDNSSDQVLSAGPATITGSTINSTSSTGSGIVAAGPATVTSSTVSGLANGIVAGPGGATVTGSTIAGNAAVGVSGTTTVTDSILSANGTANCAGAVTDGGDNLSFPATDTTCPTTFATGDPKLDILRNANGGPTPTIALLDGSAAAGLTPVGAVGCTASDTDQRGVPRLQHGQPCDAGAFELVSTSTAVGASATSLTTDRRLSLTGTVTPFSAIPVPPSGTLSFFNGSVLMAKVTLITGLAKSGPLTLPAGTYTVVAAFPGAVGFLASSSAPLSVTVSPEVPSVGAAQDLPAPLAPALLVLGGLGLLGAARRRRR